MMNNNNSETEVGSSKETKRQKTINPKIKKEKIVDKKATQKKEQIEYLNIATINVQGLNVQLKRQLIFEYLNKEGLDIVSIMETKLAQKEDLKRSLTNEYYYVYTAATLEDLGLKKKSAIETALLVKPYLRHYIYNIESFLGTAIMINFFLLGNLRTRLISIYLPSDKRKISLKTQ